MALSVWIVAQLGAFYTEHRSELLTNANRVWKDSDKAEVISDVSVSQIPMRLISLISVCVAEYLYGQEFITLFRYS